ncbi:uncharacterized protein OCT59_020701 [Rhizophagus irregularis]|uniref:uncharacterized protein n=1 Tax=Rhizophagus irregularis TaxID=588596 RepID=UPI00332030C6|nr:hypothetical protein OCT59_020701 [Rhizophagus irregularis]
MACFTGASLERRSSWSTGPALKVNSADKSICYERLRTLEFRDRQAENQLCLSARYKACRGMWKFNQLSAKIIEKTKIWPILLSTAL